MARHLIETDPARKLSIHVSHEAVEHVETRWRWLRRFKQTSIHLGEQIGILIGRASEHHTIDMGKVLARFAERFDAAIDDDGEVGPPCLDPVHPVIVDRRHVAVLLRAQAFEPGLAGMQDEGTAAASRHRIYEAVKTL